MRYFLSLTLVAALMISLLGFRLTHADHDNGADRLHRLERIAVEAAAALPANTFSDLGQAYLNELAAEQGHTAEP